MGHFEEISIYTHKIWHRATFAPDASQGSYNPIINFWPYKQSSLYDSSISDEKFA